MIAIMNLDEADHAWRTALAARDPHAIERSLRHNAESTGVMQDDERLVQSEAARLRGLLLLGGYGDIPFDTDSPWEVPADANLTEALESVWAPVAERSPNFFSVLAAETLGLALVYLKGEYLLGYLHFEGGLEEPLRDLTDLPTYTEYSRLGVLWGTSPARSDPTNPIRALDESLPVPVGDLAGVHASLLSFDVGLRLDRLTVTLGALIREHYESKDPADYVETHDFIRALNGEFDRHVLLCACDSAAECYFLDMADRDPDGVPRIALSSIDGISERPGMSFCGWVDEELPSLIFGV